MLSHDTPFFPLSLIRLSLLVSSARITIFDRKRLR